MAQNITTEGKKNGYDTIVVSADKDVAKAPSPRDAAQQAVRFIGETTIVGHSVGFDLAFLEEALGDAFRFRPGQYLDTLVLAREGMPGAESYRLADLARFFDIELTANHRALPDAEATAELLVRFGAPT